MEIRTLDESEYSNAKELLLKCYKKQAPMHIIEKEETLACVKDERAIGIASLWRNQLHDRTISVEVCVEPSFQKNGIGTALFNKLLEEYPPQENDYALDASCYSDNKPAICFLKNLKFKKYLECYNNIVDVDSIRHVRTSKRIVTLEELYQDKKMV